SIGWRGERRTGGTRPQDGIPAVQTRLNALLPVQENIIAANTHIPRVGKLNAPVEVKDVLPLPIMVEAIAGRGRGPLIERGAVRQEGDESNIFQIAAKSIQNAAFA